MVDLNFLNYLTINQDAALRVAMSSKESWRRLRHKLQLFHLLNIIFDMSSVHAVPDAYRLSLRSFYSYYLEILKRERTKFASVGIVNLNEALNKSGCLAYFRKPCKKRRIGFSHLLVVVRL